MKFLAVIFLFIHASSPSPLNIFNDHGYVCDNSHGSCVLHNVVLESESDLANVNFPSVEGPLIIASGKIPHFTRVLSDELPDVVDLTINRLQVETLYVKPEMTHLEAVGNKINALLVENDSQAYEMLTLDLSNNMLQDVAILSRFDKLRQLTLDWNNLGDVSMDLFGEMFELRKLSLANTKLLTFETNKQVHLPKLQLLSLAGNHLIELNVLMWDLPSLRLLDLSRNKLYMLDGTLDHFKALDEVNLSGNNWKCEPLGLMIFMHKFKIDADETERCRREGLTDVERICCTHDASSILGNVGSDDLGLFNDKWDELSKLREAFNDFRKLTEENLKRIGTNHDEQSLVERFEKLETTHMDILSKLYDFEKSDALNEVNDLRSILIDHKDTITRIEDKQSKVESQMEDFEERINDIQNSLNEKSEGIKQISEAVQRLEETKTEQQSFLDGKTTELQNLVKMLQSQQLKYHLSSVDLKGQIATERGRVTEVKNQLSDLAKQSDSFYKKIDQTNERIDVVWNMMDTISSADDD
ncbi:uncharacterized protein LOC134218550 [Armigeres subalbatus]|uniref:uncharacterized protein LOC134218550 n=1 Tax=Armigeres subalbatus TaxID=124917 RepID=UPI002ED5A8BF